MSEVLSISGVEVSLRRSERRRSIGMVVERDGSVIANVPASISLSEAERVLRSRELWLHSALAKRGALSHQAAPKEYVSGEGFLYLGRAYRLRVTRHTPTDETLPPLRLFRGRFQLRADCVNRGHDCFVRWYSEQAHTWLTEKLPRLQRRVGVSVQQVSVMDLGFRWASCSAAGRLNFHWRTVLLPPEFVEYIVLHELCHLIEHNHTPRFWSHVHRADRDFEQKERWLKENGGRFCL
jgi:predicted metal-dependent hydrolase